MIHVPPAWPASSPCHIAFVGEAPGDEEIARGAPLIGPSGREFNRLLRAAGIEREDCMVTNVFDFKLPGNDLKSLTGGKDDWLVWRKAGYDLPPIRFGQSIRWLAPEYEECLIRLEAELLWGQPRIIVPLGGTALWAFTGWNNIMSRRGTVHEATMTLPGAKLLPTLHPAHVLRNFKMFIIVAQDFVKAVREGHKDGFPQPKREIWIEPKFSDLWLFKQRYIDTNPAPDYLSVDIETGWGQITCIGFAPNTEHALVVPFVDLEKPNRSYWETAELERQALNFVAELLESPIPKLLQNGPYDTQWIYKKWGIQTRNYREDTRLLHHSMFPELKKDLGFLGSVYADVHAWKLMSHGRKSIKREE